MTTPAQATSIRHEVVVEAPIERAFSVFTKGFGRFKPPEHNMLGVDIAETVFELREGGHVTSMVEASLRTNCDGQMTRPPCAAVTHRAWVDAARSPEPREPS